jgi:hypothetical protein
VSGEEQQKLKRVISAIEDAQRYLQSGNVEWAARELDDAESIAKRILRGAYSS